MTRRTLRLCDKSSVESERESPFFSSGEEDDGEPFIDDLRCVRPHRPRKRRLASDSEPDASESDSSASESSSVNRRKRRVSVATSVEALPNPVFVPEVEQRSFDSWPSLQRYLASYAQRTFQVLSVKSGGTVAARNAAIKRFSNSPQMLQRELSRRLIPVSFVSYQNVFGRTHGGNPRVRSNNIRSHEHHRAIQCPAKVNACVQWNNAYKSWVVLITKQVTIHNHEVSKDRFGDYPVSRRVEEPRVLETIATMAQHGAPRKGILAYIMEHSKAVPSVKDVHNLLSRIKAAKYAAFPNVEDRVSKILRDFCLVEGNTARVFTSDNEKVKAVTLQTKHMRHMFSQFPKVVLIDATHATNNANYKLFSFMIHDALGAGQHVQHSLIVDERRETLQTVCDQFKRANAQWDEIRCIVIDKDFTEMSVIEQSFPDARVLLCQWHVIHYLHNEIGKAKYGMTDWQKRNMRLAVKALVYAFSESEYKKKIEFMKSLLGSPDKIAIWFDYFDRNWDKDTEEYEDSGFDTCPTVEALQLRVLSANKRFNRLRVLTNQIAEVGSQYGTAHVRKVEESLVAYLSLIRAGQIPVLTENRTLVEAQPLAEDGVLAEAGEEDQ